MFGLIDGTYALNVARSEAFTVATGEKPPDPKAFSDAQAYVAALNSFHEAVEAWDGVCDVNEPKCNKLDQATAYAMALAKSIQTTLSMLWS